MTQSRLSPPKCLGGMKLPCKDSNPILAGCVVEDTTPAWRLGVLGDCVGVNWERDGFPRTCTPQLPLPSPLPRFFSPPWSLWVTPTGRQGSREGNLGTPGNARAVLTCLEGDKAPRDEGDDAMGQPPHPPGTSVARGSPALEQFAKSPRRDQGELRWWWGTRLSRESHHRGPLTGCPVCPHHQRALEEPWVELDVGWGNLRRDTAGPGWVCGPGCQVTCPTFRPWKDSREWHCHRGATSTLWSPQSQRWELV